MFTLLFKTLKFLGSLGLGVTIMVILALILAWGTLIENSYGLEVSQYFLYNTPWFVLLFCVLAANILCATLLRLPCRLSWKGVHLPFLTAHLGILVLLLGSLLSWLYGQEGRVVLWEGWTVSQATSSRGQVFRLHSIAHDANAASFLSQAVDFSPGPLPWNWYNRDIWNTKVQKYRRSLGLAAYLTKPTRRQMVLPDNIVLQPLAFLPHSITEPAPPLEITVQWKDREPEQVNLKIPDRVRSVRHPMLGVLTPVASQTMQSKELVSFSVAKNMEEVRAFLASAPDSSQEAGQQGQMVLYHNGQTFFVDPQKLLNEAIGDKRYAVPNSRLEISDVRFDFRLLAFQFKVFVPSGDHVILQLQPTLPEFNRQGTRLGIFGTYWFPRPESLQSLPERATEHTQTSMLAMLGRPRVEFLQGTDHKLYYRYWSGKNFVAAGLVPMQTENGSEEWTLAEGTAEQVKIAVTHFSYHDLPGERIVEQSVDPGTLNQPRLRAKATIDGKEEYFWAELDDPHEPLPIFLPGVNRTVAFSWTPATFDLGFSVLLKKFEERTEPGGKTATHFSSLVDFGKPLTPEQQPRVRYTDFSSSDNADDKDVLIAMNRPAVHEGNGKRYRLYQLERQGPFTPLHPFFFECYDGNMFPWENRPREVIYGSILKASYDPGIGLKYMGSFLVACGAFWLCVRRYRKPKVSKTQDQ